MWVQILRIANELKSTLVRPVSQKTCLFSSWLSICVVDQGLVFSWTIKTEYFEWLTMTRKLAIFLWSVFGWSPVLITLSISCFFSIFLLSSERDAWGEHSLYQGRCRHQVLELEIEDSLESLDAQRSQLRKFVEDPAEVVRLPLSVRVVRHVITKRVDNLVL